MRNENFEIFHFVICTFFNPLDCSNVYFGRNFRQFEETYCLTHHLFLAVDGNKYHEILGSVF
jgi:hypothetical protein